MRTCSSREPAPGKRRSRRRSPSSSRPKFIRNARRPGLTITHGSSPKGTRISEALAQARRDVAFALGFTLDHYRTSAEQERALAIVDFKLDVLWCMLDAMAINYGIGEHDFFPPKP